MYLPGKDRKTSDDKSSLYGLAIVSRFSLPRRVRRQPGYTITSFSVIAKLSVPANGGFLLPVYTSSTGMNGDLALFHTVKFDQ
uniref:Uncharacterized protein n=1 Tax=Lactuca sativa TaxID=4236 RepID=A0A9R1X978_LACSA|nr:hypothetical protein LSAT_V11C500261990 [Lactuca sativa]